MVVCLQLKFYSRDFLIPGRVRVQLFQPDGKPCNPDIPNSEPSSPIALFSTHQWPASTLFVAYTAVFPFQSKCLFASFLGIIDSLDISVANAPPW